MSRFIKSLAVVSVLAATASSVNAATTVFTSAALFNAEVAAGSYLNPFTTPVQSSPVASLSYTGGSGPFSYDATAGAGGVFADFGILGNWVSADSVVLTFTGAPVTAIGGDFFVTDIGGNFFAEPVTLTLSDATTVTYSPTSETVGSFSGFISTVPITTLTFLSLPRFANIDNLRVGAAIPEPTTLAVLAGAGVLVLRRRRA